jgi:hypothetical protein
MEADYSKSISVLRYVLIVLGVRFVAASATVAYYLWTGQPSPVGSNPILIGAVGVAMIVYLRAVARPMSRSEILLFASGNAIVDVLLSVGATVGYMSLAATTFSWESFKIDFLGVSASQKVTAIIAFSLLFGAVEAFVVSAAFAWLFSRKFAKRSVADRAAE